MKHTFFIFLLLPVLIQAQNTQTIRGTVTDKDTREPLAGVTVQVLETSPTIGTATDVEGRFTLSNVPVGRHQIKCSYAGYGDWLSDAFILNSVREMVLNIEMLETGIQGNEVTVSAMKFGNEALNEASVLSARSFSVEETQRYAASANDPGRMAMGFPGVQPSRDSRSDIIVRGNSGIGLLWRLEGVDIANPNHFARRGSSGGGITIFSVSMLDNSDFSTGAFAAEYGNAYSGVFDIHFRRGNTEKRQHSFRAGILGLDFSTEGPFRKEGRASYLINYRYSTLGILNSMGIHLVGERIDNTFQDLSFNLAFPSRNNRHLFTVWSIGGLSKETGSAIKDTASWTQYDDYTQYNFNTDMGATGATWTAQISDDSYIKTNLVATGQKIFVQDDTLNLQGIAGRTNFEDYREGRYVLSSFLNKKISKSASLKTGFFFNLIPYNFFWDNLSDGVLIRAQGATQLIQTYAQWRLRAGARTTIQLGAHAMYFTLNKQKSIEPRAALSYQINEKNKVSVAVGQHSRVLPLGNYFVRVNDVEANRNANFVRGVHSVLGYDWLPGRSMRVHVEGYAQIYYNVPVSALVGSSWSVLNIVQGYTRHPLVNSGSGRNFGVDFTLEQSFRKGAFFLLSGSVMKAEYTDAYSRLFPAVFSSGFSGAFMGGKEWNLKKSSTLQLGTKILYNGGQRLTPLLGGQTVSRYAKDPLLDESKAFSEQVSPYFRPDMRVAYRRNRKHAAWWIALDIQNIISRHNVDALSRNYDPDTNAWVYRKQSGLTPVLSFQIDF